MSKQRKRHTPEQIVRKLGQADQLHGEGNTVADACPKIGVTEQTYDRSRNQYSGIKTDNAQRLKELEKQNATLKQPAYRGRARKGHTQGAG